MKPGKSIKDVYMRFLKSLEKTYISEEMMRKVQQCLLRSKWGPNVSAIEGAQDLKTLKLDNLDSKLLTYEIHLHEENEKHTLQ